MDRAFEINQSAGQGTQLLQHEPNHFEQIVEQAPAGVLLLDPHSPTGDWPIVYANRISAELHGCAAGALVGQPMYAGEPDDAALARLPGLLDQLHREGIARVQFQCHSTDRPACLVEAVLSPIWIDGHEYVLRIDHDISAQQQAEADLRRQVALDHCAAEIARQISDLPIEQTDAAIMRALARVGEFLQADRTFVFLCPSEHVLSNSHEWCAPAIEPQQARFQHVPIASIPWLAARFAHDQMIRLTALADLSASAAAERALLESRGVQAMLAVPFTQNGMPIGFIGCDSVHSARAWASEDVALLLLVGESIGRAIMRQQVLHRLQMNHARYRMVTEHATDIISLHDQQGVCQFCSPIVRAVLGYDPDELVGASPFDLIHPDDRHSALARGKVHDSGAITTAYRIRHKAGHYLWIETSARAVYDPQTGAIREIVAVTRDVDARKNYEAQIEQLAYYDSLTLLANRRRFHDQIRSAIHGIAHTGGQVALLYLDLDYFKKVNDTLGHDAGDELLVQVASRLKAQVRHGDTLARLGGDEFAILLDDLADDAPAAAIAQRIVNQIKQPFEVRGQTIHLGVSIGIACAPQDGQSFEDLLKHADIAMYRAKIDGDCYRFYDPTLSAFSRERLQLEDELRRAIARDELTLHYQPIFDLRTSRRVGAEALVRWKHPTRGLLMPGAFVPLAEECGLISQLDRWVLLAALRQLAGWAAAGLTVNISINLSARTLHDRDLVQYAGECLLETGAPPERAVLEVTESAVMHDRETASRALDELKRLGMRIALDDFGSGHAALAYLKWLPVDEIKIDRSFVQGIGHDPRDEGVVRAIVAMSEGLRVDVVAEGITEVAQQEWLQSIGCFLGQGYGLAYPAPPEAFS